MVHSLIGWLPKYKEDSNNNNVGPADGRGLKDGPESGGNAELTYRLKDEAQPESGGWYKTTGKTCKDRNHSETAVKCARVRDPRSVVRGDGVPGVRQWLLCVCVCGCGIDSSTTAVGSALWRCPGVAGHVDKPAYTV